MHNLSEPMGQSKGSSKGKFVGMNASIKNTERSQRNDLMLHLKFLEK
jgi:putative lipoic acid-binding regulatory protein